MFDIYKETDSDITTNPNMYVHENGDIFYTTEDGMLYKISTDGSVTSSSASGLTTEGARQMKYYNGYLYVLWKPGENLTKYNIEDIKDKDSMFSYNSSYTILDFEFINNRLFVVRRTTADNVTELIDHTDTIDIKHQMITGTYQILQMQRNRDTEDRLIVAGEDGYIFCYELSSGTVIWSYNDLINNGADNLATVGRKDIWRVEYADDQHIYVMHGYKHTNKTYDTSFTWFEIVNSELDYVDYQHNLENYHVTDFAAISTEELLLYSTGDNEIYLFNVNNWGDFFSNKVIEDIPVYKERVFNYNSDYLYGVTTSSDIVVYEYTQTDWITDTQSRWSEGTLVDTVATSEGLELSTGIIEGHRVSPIIDLSSLGPLESGTISWTSSLGSKSYFNDFSSLDGVESYLGTTLFLEDTYIYFTDEGDNNGKGIQVETEVNYPAEIITTLRLGEETEKAQFQMYIQDLWLELNLFTNKIETALVDLTKWQTLKIEIVNVNTINIYLLKDNNWELLLETSAELDSDYGTLAFYHIEMDYKGSMYIQDLSMHSLTDIKVDIRIDGGDWENINNGDTIPQIESGESYETLQTRQTLTSYENISPIMYTQTVSIELYKVKPLTEMYLNAVSTSSADILSLLKDLNLIANGKATGVIFFNVGSTNYWVPIEVDQRMEVD